MSPSFFQMVGCLQSKVEEELEVLDVRNGICAAGEQGGGRPGCWAVRGVGVQGLMTFLSLVSASALS